MRSVFKMASKVLLSGFVAFLFLCLFSLLYYNPPAHIPSETGATDYTRDPGAIYAYMMEGRSFGRIDKNGYNNIGESAQGGLSPNILFMGSSHTEAMYVMQDENAPHILGELLAEYKPGATVYNIGMSAHDIMVCFSNLEAALKAFSPRDYVVIETMVATVPMSSLTKFNSGALAEIHADPKGGWKYYIQQIPYAKLAFMQYRNITVGTGPDGYSPEAARDDAAYADMLNKAMRSYGDTASANGVKPVILYHPNLVIQPDGSVIPYTDFDDLELLNAACEQNGIMLVDMTAPFVERYERDYTLPHGFLNTEIGKGHLNADGSRMVAEELFRALSGGIS